MALADIQLEVPKPPTSDIGAAEALTVLHALGNSRLLSQAGSADLIFSVTGRYAFLHDLERTVRDWCGPLPLLVLQNPAWAKTRATMRGWDRQETSILGFKRDLSHHLFDWALPSHATGPVARFAAKSHQAACMECHAGRVRKLFERAASPSCMCKLPPMTLAFPVREGSVSILQTSI